MTLKVTLKQMQYSNDMFHVITHGETSAFSLLIYTLQVSFEIALNELKWHVPQYAYTLNETPAFNIIITHMAWFIIFMPFEWLTYQKYHWN